MPSAMRNMSKRPVNDDLGVRQSTASREKNVLESPSKKPRAARDVRRGGGEDTQDMMDIASSQRREGMDMSNYSGGDISCK